MAGDETNVEIENEKNNPNDVKKKEELQKQIRIRVASEERAFRIVETLVDVTVSMERLKEMAHFLLPAHYKDITEERAIAKLCGYPVCNNKLAKVMKQKYQISTKTNKVYDITEKKDFCSSKCYKLSKIFEKQILESPLWVREKEKPADFLIPETKTGWLGVEVIGQSAEDKLEDEEDEKKKEASILESRNWINELQENLREEKSLVFKEPEDPLPADILDNAEPEAEADPLDVVEVVDENDGFNLLDVSDFLKAQVSDDDAISDASERLSTVFDSDDDPDIPDETILPPTHHKKRANCSQVDDLADGLSRVDISKDGNLEKQKKGLGSNVDYYKKLLKLQKKSLTVFIDDVPSGACAKPAQSVEKISKNVKSRSSPSPTAKLLTSENPPSASSGIQNPAPNKRNIQHTVHSWITQKSLQYLGIAKEEGRDTTKDSKSPVGNPDFAKLCDRLHMKGMEFDELLEERLPQTVNPPRGDLPSFENLQKETAKFSVKVKEYYKPPPKKEEKADDSTQPVYILPPVDSHSQIPMRRSIVLQQLGKRIDALLSPMGVLLGEISTEMNALVSTFNLQNDTIAFKPAEWSVVGIFLIFMLSKKLERLDVALKVPKVQDRFTGMLNKFDMNFQDAQQILEDEILPL